jgi:glyoxalase family protein
MCNYLLGEDTVKLEGIHHITAITGDAPRNVDFYTRVLGLRMAAKTVNQDDPTVYHLFYADELGRPGAELTFFEYPGATPGRPGPGMVHRIVSRVGSAEAIGFWEQRLAAEGVHTERDRDRLRFADFEGLGHELEVDASGDEPLAAEHPEIPAEHALRGFGAVRAYSFNPGQTAAVLERLLGAEAAGEQAWELRGERRGGVYVLDPAPEQRGLQGAGTVHHVAFGTTVAEHPEWFERIRGAGVQSSPIIDRHYFHSIYFREPGGVLFEIADDGPGFTVDVPLDELGSKVILPPKLEPHRAEIERILTPLPDPRAGWATARR